MVETVCCRHGVFRDHPPHAQHLDATPRCTVVEDDPASADPAASADVVEYARAERDHSLS